MAQATVSAKRPARIRHLLWQQQGVTIALAEPNGRLQETLTKAGLDSKIGQDRISHSVDAALKAYLTAYPQAKAATPQKNP